MYIFSNINLEIFKGQKIGIIGKTGSGKSTLMNILSGIILPKQVSKFIIDGKKAEQNTILDNNFIFFILSPFIILLFQILMD